MSYFKVQLFVKLLY